MDSKSVRIAYANWKIGRTQGEVDLVGINEALQKPCWAVEIKWSDRFFDKPTELSSLQYYMEKNHLSQALVTSISQAGMKNMDFGKLHFIPCACYAYTVGRIRFDRQEEFWIVKVPFSADFCVMTRKSVMKAI